MMPWCIYKHDLLCTSTHSVFSLTCREAVWLPQKKKLRRSETVMVEREGCIVLNTNSPPQLHEDDRRSVHISNPEDFQNRREKSPLQCLPERSLIIKSEDRNNSSNTLEKNMVQHNENEDGSNSSVVRWGWHIDLTPLAMHALYYISSTPTKKRNRRPFRARVVVKNGEQLLINTASELPRFFRSIKILTIFDEIVEQRYLLRTFAIGFSPFWNKMKLTAFAVLSLHLFLKNVH